MPLLARSSSVDSTASRPAEEKAIFAQAVKLYQELAEAWKKSEALPSSPPSPSDEARGLLEMCRRLLARLKILLTQLEFVPTAGQQPPQRLHQSVGLV